MFFCIKKFSSKIELDFYTKIFVLSLFQVRDIKITLFESPQPVNTATLLNNFLAFSPRAQSIHFITLGVNYYSNKQLHNSRQLYVCNFIVRNILKQ